MANKAVFATRSAGTGHPGFNREGAPAHVYEPRHALAQLALTGTFRDTFYVDAGIQAEEFLAAAAHVEDDRFLAQAAIYARKHGHMKDAPALLLAILSGRNPVLFARAFPKVVDNARMLRTFVQIMRSGVAGRKSLGTRPKRMIQAYLNRASDVELLRASVGQSPSLGDIIKMVHPKAATPERNALFAWAAGRPCDVSSLPVELQKYLRVKTTGHGDVPDVPFQMLTSLPLTNRHWARIAERAGWQMVRMNLMTFKRHGVFDLHKMEAKVAATLRNRKAIRASRVLPYQLMMAHLRTHGQVPDAISKALEDAMDVALENVPALPGFVAVCPDVSGSMDWSVTGDARGPASKVRFVDVAALITAALVRKNKSTLVLPFDTLLRRIDLHPSAGVVANAKALAGLGGGGTSCQVPLEWLVQNRIAPDLVIFVSDNQSWVGAASKGRTPVMKAWVELKRRNPDARMVCIDIAPYGTTQAPERQDILNVGGFSDAVFKVMAAFARGDREGDRLVKTIETIEI